MRRLLLSPTESLPSYRLDGYSQGGEMLPPWLYLFGYE